MDLCIKTNHLENLPQHDRSFNPCFNGSMYKNFQRKSQRIKRIPCFNPCFNGSMYKNCYQKERKLEIFYVSILVLMDLCIKTTPQQIFILPLLSFNPCFNGSMYKNFSKATDAFSAEPVSILVLMDLCIKTFF